MPHASCCLTSIIDKTPHGPVIALFSVQPQQLFSYVRGILVTRKPTIFHSCWLIDIFWLFSKLKLTRSICDTLFDLYLSSELPQKPWQHGHNNRKWLKQPQSHFRWAIPHKSHHFLLFWCMLFTVTLYISSSSENMNSTVRVSRLPFRFLWLCSRGVFRTFSKI